MSEAPDRAARLSDTSRVETFSDGQIYFMEVIV